MKGRIEVAHRGIRRLLVGLAFQEVAMPAYLFAAHDQPG